MALISVLLVVAVLSALVYQFIAKHSLNLAHSQNSIGFDQALAYALGGETLARQALMDDLTTTGPGIDTFQEAWAQALPPFEVEDVGILEIQARDLNGCFNVNALAGEAAGDHLRRFKALLRSLEIPELFADTAKDWVDADQNVSGFGAEDSDYLVRQPPYRTADHRLAHISELRLLRDMAPEQLDRLRPHICALPSANLQINVNTATIQVLAALEPAVDELSLRQLAESERSYRDVAAFTSDYVDFTAAAALLAVTSEFFEVQVRVHVGSSIAVLTSVLHRDPEQPAIRLLSRELGRDYRSRLNVQTEGT